MIHKNAKLSTSNQQKIKEYRSFNLDIEVIEGKDLPEVQADALTVSIYKAIEAGENILVEDTVLIVNDEEVVDIRWKMDEVALMDNPSISWNVFLSILDGDNIYIYKGFTQCVFNPCKEDPFGPFAFDPFLKPKGEDLTFYELYLQNKKHLFSPRAKAVKNFIEGSFYKKVPLNSVEKWTGDYQKD